jgi:hypothetical protein
MGKFLKMLRPSKRRTSTELVIDYSPALDGDPDPGEVVWTWVTYEDDGQGSSRSNHRAPR